MSITCDRCGTDAADDEICVELRRMVPRGGAR